MNKRSRILAGLTTGVMAVGAMCFGFARWSSDVTLNGSVAASGKWDVAVTDTGVELSNAGAEFSTTEVITAADAYAVYAYYIESNGNYLLRLDTANPETVDVTAYKNCGSSYYSSYWDSRYFTGNAASGYHNYYFDQSLEGVSIQSAVIKASVAQQYGITDGQFLGYAAKKANVSASEVTGETVYTDTTVTYASVDFTLPEAWANYSVTITNNGTANANLSDYAFDVSELNEEIYTVDTPELGEEVLAPGESCTFNFVVKVDTDAKELAEEAANFIVTLNYVQDTVNEAPGAGHSH